ncbi:L,D-transpeptidase [Methylocapsa acidiphila]|uniref:L,D-transpeptidase n=1 Tax=Methylocapsa acidiphila TaxID=133552 RepID=UPI0004233A14|nr:L,D-transpeptidase [Methylocapsa acidiphila]
MRIASGACALFLGLFNLTAAHATVVIDINLSTQTMHVRGNSGNYDWRVSTARSGFVTPRGHYRPISLQRMHYSRKYDMTPMPYSIFFRGGYAIHGTSSTGQLGRPVSHGCVRLAPGNAARLFEMVRSEGGSISISGSPPHSLYARKRHSATYAGWRGRPEGAMSYAPARRTTPIGARALQLTNPVFRAPPSGSDWPYYYQ